MRKKFTIVVADDDQDDQELMRHGLKDCKIQVDIVTLFDGVKLMDYLNKRYNYKEAATPDLILLDINMPLMDGFQALAQIKKNPALIEIPVYIISTSKSEKDRNKALELGATGFYTKGSSSKNIISIMKEICEECFSEAPDELF